MSKMCRATIDASTIPYENQFKSKAGLQNRWAYQFFSFYFRFVTFSYLYLRHFVWKNTNGKMLKIWNATTTKFKLLYLRLWLVIFLSVSFIMWEIMCTIISMFKINVDCYKTRHLSIFLSYWIQCFKNYMYWIFSTLYNSKMSYRNITGKYNQYVENFFTLRIHNWFPQKI